jgi:hypothetical protein
MRDFLYSLLPGDGFCSKQRPRAGLKLGAGPKDARQRAFFLCAQCRRLKFLQRLPQARFRNFKSKAALGS